MKFERQNAPPIVVGKRVTVGAAVKGLLAALAAVWPDHAATMIALAIPITFAVQVWVGYKWGITT